MLHRRRRIAPRLVAAVLAVCMLSSCGANTETANTYLPDIASRSSTAVPVHPQAFREEKNAQVVEEDLAETAILEQMELVLSNEYAELYFGPWKDVALRDKKTGAILFSNQEAYDADLEGASQDRKKVAYSQLQLEYYTSTYKVGTLYSYPDAYDGKSIDQVSYTVEDDVLKVAYTLGNVEDSTGLYPAMREETFNALSEKVRQLVDEKKISRTSNAKFKSWYIRVELDTLNNEDRAQMLEAYPVLNELGTLYILSSSISVDDKEKLREILTLAGVDEAAIEEETAHLGAINRQQKNPVFGITLCYQLDGADLLAWVDTAAIQGMDEFYLTKIQLLGSMGAVLAGEENYLFIPDGSGSIISGTTTSREIDRISLPFYGSNLGLDFQADQELSAAASFPVYGIVNGDKAVFSIVESGEASGGLTAVIPGVESNYYRVGLWMDYLLEDSMSYVGQSSTDIKMFSKTVANTQFRVRFHQMTGDRASYVSMADYYRDYLAATEQLPQLEEMGAEAPMGLDLIGAISKEKQIMGVSIETLVAATTIEQAGALAEEIRSGGSGPLDVRLSGAVNGGISSTIAKKVGFESVVGTAEDWQAFCEQLEQNGDSASLTLDWMRLYKKGNGLNDARDLTRYMSRYYANYPYFSPNTGARATERSVYLVKSSRLKELADDVLSSLSKLKVDSLYLPGSGTLIYSDFKNNEEIPREEAKREIVAALEKYTQAGIQIQLDGVNAYALRYASGIQNVPVESSHIRLETYDIPFVSMVLHGLIPMYVSPVNEQPLYQQALLKAVESGAGISFRLMDAENSILFNTEYSDYLSISKAIWMDEVKRVYTEVRSKLDGLNNQRIIDHSNDGNGIVQVTYENGAKVILNYNYEAVTVSGETVEPMDFVVIR